MAWDKECAIIILNYKSAQLTIENVNQLRKFSHILNIIIVDNCSPDDSVIVLKKQYYDDQFTHIVVNDSNSGYAAGNNVGIRYVAEHITGILSVAIVNPDIAIKQASDIQKLHDQLLRDSSLMVITSQTVFNGRIRFPNDFGWKHLTPKYMMFGGTILGKFLKPSIRYTSIQVNENNVGYIDIAQGCFFLAKLDLLFKVGLLDENTFLYQEEAILAKKVQRAGYKEGVLLDVFINHNHREKDKSLISRKNKLFDMKCFYSSRMHYIRNYSDRSGLFIFVACIFLKIDHAIKRVFFSL